MTSDRPAPRGVSPRDRRNDLLSDLRATVPVPPATDPPAGPAADPAPPAEPAPPGADGTPTTVGTPAVELRLTPLRWSPLGAALTTDGTGVVLAIGPLQLFLGRRTD